MGPGQTDGREKPSVSEPVKSRENDELVKQEMLVQYLQDAYSFSLKITEAISIISRMMYENTSTGNVGAPLCKDWVLRLEKPVLSVFYW